MSNRRSNHLNRFYSAGDILNIPRLVNRDLPYNQSRNKLKISLKEKSHIWGLQREDWFHVLLQNTFLSLGIMLLVWTISILIFAGLYMGVDAAYSTSNCGLVDPGSNRLVLQYGAYFAFSLETTTTVGYGLPGSTNAFFENCGGIQALIFFNMVWSMMYNAFLFAFFFARLAKTEARGAQVVFSKTAILSYNPAGSGTGGPWTFSVRVVDIDSKYPVVEAHVRLYAKVGPQLIEMRVLSPNDIIGASLFLSWPTTIRHEVDVHSPLHPPMPDRFRLPNCGLNLRNAESVVGDVEQFACPVCGEHYGDMDRIRKHVKYYSLLEKNDGLPVEGTHQELTEEDLKSPDPPTEDDIKNWFPDEVIVVVEGIDPLASGTFQALQSYTVDNLTWGGHFCDCVAFSETKTVVDLNKFHRVVNFDSERDTSNFDLEHAAPSNNNIRKTRFNSKTLHNGTRSSALRKKSSSRSAITKSVVVVEEEEKSE